MNCPKCPNRTALATTQLARKTSLGYQVFRCRDCRRVFNERTGTVRYRSPGSSGADRLCPQLWQCTYPSYSLRTGHRWSCIEQTNVQD